MGVKFLSPLGLGAGVGYHETGAGLGMLKPASPHHVAMSKFEVLYFLDVFFLTAKKIIIDRIKKVEIILNLLMERVLNL